MTREAGKDFERMDRMKARQVVVEKLTEQGLLLKTEDYVHNVGYSQRSRVPIEPYLSEQWFLKYPSVEKSRACVGQELGSAGFQPASVSNEHAAKMAALPGKMRFHPQRWAKVYDHWMENIKDWCISRQLWWGHRIPVWTQQGITNSLLLAESRGFNLESYLNKLTQDDPEGIVYERHPTGQVVVTPGAPVSQFKRYVAITPGWEAVAQQLEEYGFTQDPDVLDTWFSSWLWPFATMGWTGDKSQDSNNPTLRAFYPTTDLVTGPDIIFFWVARMIMAGYEFMGDLPFRNVYFTGIIRDKQGRKMSKSLGNSPDPLDLIGKYGADALRFGTMRSAPLGQDILFDEQNVELGRNFCNKLWNACRFRQLVGQASSLSPSDSGNVSKSETGGTPVLPYEVQGEINPQLLTSDDKWILLKLAAAIREINTAFAEYKFSDATATLYRFFWGEYCDWYVEASKAVLSHSVEPLKRETVESSAGSTIQPFNDSTARKANTLAVIDFVLSHTLRLFHPFLPFITEELWHGMGYAEDMPDNQGGRTIMTAPWPKPLDDDFKSHYGLTEQDEKYIEARNELVTQGRNLRRTANIAANKKIKFILKPARALAPHDVEVLRLLLNAEAVEVNANYQPARNTMTVRVTLGDLFLPLEGLIDVEAEKARLKKELAKIEAEAAKVEQKLANPNFTQKVPANVLAEHRQRLADRQAKRDHVKAALAALQG
jgi:valyl-tRNA synthetase